MNQLTLVPGLGDEFSSLRSRLFGNNEQGLWLRPDQFGAPLTQYQESTGQTLVTAVGQTVGLSIDWRLGRTLGAELRQTGVVGLVGTATAATYNTATGDGVIHRVDGSNQSYVEIPVTPGHQKIQITHTGGSSSIIVSDGSIAGPTLMTAIPSTSYDRIINPTATKITLQTTNGSSNISFTLTSIKLLPGNHAYQGTASKRALLACVPARGRVNELIHTERFDNASWGKAGLNATGTPQWIFPNVGPNESSAFKIILSNGISTAGATSNGLGPIGSVASGVYRYSIHLKSAEVTSARFRENISVGSFLIVNLTNGTITGGGGPGTQFVDPLVTDAGDGWWKVSFTTPTMTNLGKYVVRPNQDGDGTGGILATCAQIELGSTATNYQRVGAGIFDVTEVGQPTLYGWLSDGVDDNFETNAFDPAASLVTVCAGVRKLSDAFNGVLLEHSANADSTNGSFYLSSSSGGGANFIFFNRGTIIRSVTQSGHIAPASRVVSGIGDISGLLTRIRVNSTSSENVLSLGTGNYTIQKNYLLARGGTVFFFNGYTFALCLRFAATDSSLLSRLEDFVAQKSLGAKL
jgi:hypothetical protein